jgi:hypothetical protein
MVELGIATPGSNILRDRVRYEADGAVGVDAGEWLVRTELARRVPFPDTFSTEDWIRVVPEDTKFLRLLLNSGVIPVCSEIPTLRYNLGGMSNEFAVLSRNEEDLLWQKPSPADGN